MTLLRLAACCVLFHCTLVGCGEDTSKDDNLGAASVNSSAGQPGVSTPVSSSPVSSAPGGTPTAVGPTATAIPTSAAPTSPEATAPAPEASSVPAESPGAGGSPSEPMPSGMAGAGGAPQAAGGAGGSLAGDESSAGTMNAGGESNSEPDAGMPSGGMPGTEPVEPIPEIYSPCPTDGSPCAIMPLGDSITFGEGSSGGGYRVGLFERAVNDGQQITFIGTASANGPNMVAGQPFPRAHQGHQGYVIDTGGYAPTASLSQVVDMALPSLDPHIVLLMIGTNDINGNNNLGDAPNRLGALIDKIINFEPDAVVVVAQLTPTQDANLNARIETYNAAMVGVVEQRAAADKHVMLVDMYGAFTSNPNYGNELMFDRLHPNDAGYEVMAGVWYDAIAGMLPTP